MSGNDKFFLVPLKDVGFSHTCSVAKKKVNEHIDRIGQSLYNRSMSAKLSIMKSAIEVFSTLGIKKASIADIARHAGVSKPLLFHHFKTKAALYEATRTYALSLIQHLQDAFHQNQGHFFEKLYDLQIAKYELELATPHLFEFILIDLEKAPELPPYPFTEKDLTLFKDDVDPQLIYQWFYVMSLGYRQRLLDGADAPTIFQEFRKAFEYIKHISLKEGD